MSESSSGGPLRRSERSSRSDRLRLPIKPSAEHLRKAAKRLARQASTPLAEAQHQLARRYGARHWAELMQMVETMLRGAESTSGRAPMQALPEAANAGDLERVRAILQSGSYTRHDLDLALARSVLRFAERQEIARLLLDWGADPDGQYGADYGPIVFVTGEVLDVDGLKFLLDAGADVTFAPVQTKYGMQCPLSYWLGSYLRGRNDAKHRGIALLLAAGAVVPEEVTPEMLAIHRGDAPTLARLLQADPAAVSRRYPRMPYGNIALHGATLLHAAVEFGEVECIDTLVRFGADLNARAHEIGGIGGQTPVFHAVRAHADAQLPVLRHLNRNFGSRINVTVRATFTLYGRAVQSPVTPAELAVLPVEDLSPSPASAAELKKLEPAEPTRGSSVDAFIRSAVIPIDADHRSGNLAVASALLARQPSLPDDDFYAACVLGDLRAVTRHLERDPSLATSNGGPLGWPAICYVTFSRFLRDRRDDRQVEFAQVVRRLLDHGADARSFWMSSGQWGCEETALYGAAGIANSDAVTNVLLDAGATPDEPDTETLYHLAEHTDLRCLRLVLSRAKRGPHFDYAMCHQMDHEDTEGLRVFIEMGGDVNCLIDRGQPKGWRPLQFAIDRGRSTRVIAMLLDAGADPTLTTDAGHTAMQFARMRGRADVTALLASRGVVEPLSERDRWLDAVNRADRAEIARLRPKPLQLHPHEIAMLPHAASSGRIDTVRAMLDEGWPIDARGMWGGPALHLALVGGQVEVARLLIERGADLLIRNDYGGDALGCLLFAYRNGRPEVEPLIEMITSRIPRSRVVELIDWHETDAQGDRGIARRLERAIQADTGS